MLPKLQNLQKIHMVFAPSQTDTHRIKHVQWYWLFWWVPNRTWSSMLILVIRWCWFFFSPWTFFFYSSQFLSVQLLARWLWRVLGGFLLQLGKPICFRKSLALFIWRAGESSHGFWNYFSWSVLWWFITNIGSFSMTGMGKHQPSKYPFFNYTFVRSAVLTDLIS